MQKAPIPERGEEQAWSAGHIICFDWPAIAAAENPDLGEKVADALLGLDQAKEVLGPFANGVAAVNFEAGKLGQDELVEQVVRVVRSLSAPKTSPQGGKGQ